MSRCLDVEVVCTTTCTELPWRKGSMTSREKIWSDRLLRTKMFWSQTTWNGPSHRFRQCFQDSKLKGQVERYQKVSWTKAENRSRRSQNVRCDLRISRSVRWNDETHEDKDVIECLPCSWTWQTWQDRYLESSQRSKDSNLLRQFFSKKKCHVRDVDATKTIDQVHLGIYLTLHTLRHVAAGFDFSRYSSVELKVSTACLEPIVRSE